MSVSRAEVGGSGSDEGKIGGIATRLKAKLLSGGGSRRRGLGTRLKGWFSGGRLIALAVLLGLGVIRTIDPSPVESLRLRTFDLYQQIKPRENQARPVTIVDFDDESLAAIGQWPWPRHILAQMVTNLMQRGAIGIGFDAVFPEADRLSPNLLADSVRGLSDEIVNELNALPSNDQLFAEALRNSRSVLGQSAFTRIVPEAAGRLPEKSPRAFIGKDPRPFLPRFVSVVRNNAVIEPAALGHGMFTVPPEPDGVVRRVPAIIRVNDIVYPSLAVEMLRIAGGGDAYAINTGAEGIRDVRVRVGKQRFTIKTTLDGRIWVNFSPHDREGRYVSAKDVIDGTVPVERIQNKWILVGTSATGLLDIRSTPIDDVLPGVEVHANILETILSQTQLIRPPDSLGRELVFAIVVGILLLILVPILGAAWSLGVTVVLIGGVAAFSWFSYSGLSYGDLSWWFLNLEGQQLLQGRTLIDVTYPGISTFLLYSLLTYTSYSKTAAERK